jgi:hypothetical protein
MNGIQKAQRHAGDAVFVPSGSRPDRGLVQFQVISRSWAVTLSALDKVLDGSIQLYGS